MLTKAITLFLIGMAALALWGRLAAGRAGPPKIGRYCSHCGRPRPCGCPKAGA